MPAKEEKLFLEAYEKYGDAIFRHCCFKVSDRELALDLAQETFKRVWLEIARGTQIVNMRAFLYKVANNLAVDEYRKKKVSSLEAATEGGVQFASNKDKDIGKIIDAKTVFSKAEQLDEIYREAVLLRYAEELSVKEIAEIAGESENVISVRIHRGLAQLRIILEKEEYGPET